MDSAKIQGNDFLDILFDGRNKDYGAYALRSRYDRRVRNAVMGTASIVLVMVGGYVLNNTLSAKDNINKPVFLDKTTTLTQIDQPEPDPVIPPPVQATPPPAAAPTIDFASLKVVPNDQVSPEDEPPKISDIGNKTVGLQNTEGDLNGVADGLADVSAGTPGVVTAPVAPEREETLTFVEIMPEFPGGEEALRKYLQKNLRYPNMAVENGIQGPVYVQFVVSKDGTISQVKTVGAAKGGGLEEEAVRVVNKMPNWKAGKQNGRTVNVLYNLPIRFSLENQ
ncbi:energy transducer TonB [Chitinophaga sp. HK235]|uniref:energy transducer TonB n=1 Tax=Chitinophaga sp. HK235 TaxID=2952571 RepID=UPI001BA61D22|nr:energy transducer TonB [Chitinophaga sp. HK235]